MTPNTPTTPAPPFPDAPAYMANCRELAPALLADLAGRDAMAREIDGLRRDLVRVGHENDGLRTMVAKLREKVQWLESELSTTGRAAQ